jgi:uncharacterized protein YdbL (DUF1318 family)
MKAMKRRLLGFSLSAVLLAIPLACVTINVYFPEEAVQDLSEQIEEEVQKRAAEIEEQGAAEDGATTDDESAGAAGDSSSLLDLLLGVQPVHAAEGVAAPEVSNPAIRKIIDARARRVGAINEYKSRGVIGENNLALLEIRELDALSDLRERADAQKLVREENADRERLFKEIAAAKSVDLSQLPKIQQTYAGTLRDHARPGDWIQLPDGSWRQK